MPTIEYDNWQHVQAAMRRLDHDEVMYAIYSDEGTDGLTYIAFSNLRIIFGTGHELPWDQVEWTEFYGSEVRVRAKEGFVTLLFDGDKQAHHAWALIWTFRCGKTYT